MRAISQDAFGGPEVLRLIEIRKPVPLPTEVLVRVVAAGVNPVDDQTRAGQGVAAVLGTPPFILGWDVCGTVEEVGHGVHTLRPGDEVFGMPWFPRQAGAYAEYVTAPSRQFARKPATLTHQEAAAAPLAALTAWELLTAATTVRPGQRVLVHAAAGGVGHLAVQLAKHFGAYVIGTASAANHEWLRKLGADELIDYRAQLFEDVVSDVDLVLDLIPDDHVTGLRSLTTLRPGGLLLAVPAGVSPEMAARAAQLGVRAEPFLVEPDGAALGRIAALIDEGALSIEVAKVFPLEQAAEAHHQIATRHTQGKLVLQVAH
jgi:NADPH:quinone reductase-like Zn-dependent oxidoreductase